MSSGDLVLAMHELHRGKASGFWLLARLLSLVACLCSSRDISSVIPISAWENSCIEVPVTFLMLPVAAWNNTVILQLEFGDLRSFQESPNSTNVTGTLLVVFPSVIFSDSIYLGCEYVGAIRPSHFIPCLLRRNVLDPNSRCKPTPMLLDPGIWVSSCACER